MGLDEALLLLRIEDKVEDTFRFYSFFLHASQLSYFQRLNSSIDIDYCLRNDIDYVRRITGEECFS